MPVSKDTISKLCNIKTSTFVKGLPFFTTGIGLFCVAFASVSRMSTATQQHIILAEKLIALVVRAFYSDNYVVLLDSLVHEKYIIEEELGPRLQISNKEVSKIKNQLEKEGLIKFEDVIVDNEVSKASWKCYYIDYHSFISLVRFRIFLMQQYLVKEENNELNEVYYQCPTCGNKYSSLEVQRLRAGDYKFICSNCFQGSDFRSLKQTEAYYRLIEVDNRKEVKKLQSLHTKLEQQLNYQKIDVLAVDEKLPSRSLTSQQHPQQQPKEEVVLHDGIYDLLGQLRDVVLPRNLPSENIKKGHVSSVIIDKEMAQEITYNLDAAKNGKYGSQMKKKHLDNVKQQLTSGGGMMSQGNPTFDITILEDGVESSFKSSSISSDIRGTLAINQNEEQAKKYEASLPEFLRKSGVAGAEKVLESVDQIQKARDANRGQITSKQIDSAEQDENRIYKKARADDYSFPSSTYPKEDVIVQEETRKIEFQNKKKVEEEEEEDLDDVAWEQEEES
jgi:transcription initiation factor IIE alpha subunit